MNAYKNYQAVNFEFPYTPAQVLAYYTANNVNAFNFFVMYMQGVN